MASSMSDLLFQSKRSYLAVVGIDFGTAYSGFAFSFNKESQSDSIFMNKDWGLEQGFQGTPKAPTCLLLKQDKSFDSFGYDAEEKYTSMLGTDETKEYYYFERFKMALHNDENLNTETRLEAANGKKVKAMTVFAHSIRFLKDQALDVIRERTGDDGYNENDVQWVITVPAIWKPAAKQFMRESAYEAGIASPEDPEQLLIALEPEAASLCCREKKVVESLSDSSGRAGFESLSTTNTQYMVVDIGGGTLDVTVHEVLDDGTMKEIHQATGGPHGGMRVNEQFVSILEQIFGTREVENYRRKNPSDFLVLMNDFESKKRGRRVFEDKETRIRLPPSFTSSFFQQNLSSFKTIVTRLFGADEVKLIRSEYLSLSPNVMRRLFQPVVTAIKDHLSTVLRKPQLSRVKSLILVGGFADSVILQNEIKGIFSPRYRVLIPQYASIAVVQGAVLFAKRPTQICARVVGTTYGAGKSRDFIEGIHPEDKKFYADGIAKCGKLLSIFVKQGSVVNIGQSKTKSYRALYATATECHFSFYTSENPDVTFTTDPRVKKIGKLVVQSPDSWRGRDREYKLSMYFGGTEITATAVDVSSGNVAQTKLDFLVSN